MPAYVRNQSPRDRTKGQPELAGGYKVGDTVVSRIAVHSLDYTRGSVAVGDVGVVVGPATNPTCIGSVQNYVGEHQHTGDEHP